MFTTMPSRRIKLLILGGGLVSATALVLLKRDCLLDIASSLCEMLSTDPVVESDLSRDAFAQTLVDQVDATPGHTHPSAAALRSSATRFAQNFAQYTGTELYIPSMSKSDQRKGLRGTRRWYWTKDVNADNREDVPTPRDTRYMCDVDYYVDMNVALVEQEVPLLLYTFVPEAAASCGHDDTSFYFEEDGSLTTLVAGGGQYNHLLWDYGSDSSS